MSDHILSILPIYKWSPSTVKHTESAFSFLFEARVRVTHVMRRRRHTFASSQKIVNSRSSEVPFIESHEFTPSQVLTKVHVSLANLDFESGMTRRARLLGGRLCFLSLPHVHRRRKNELCNLKPSLASKFWYYLLHIVQIFYSDFQ